MLAAASGGYLENYLGVSEEEEVRQDPHVIAEGGACGARTVDPSEGGSEDACEEGPEMSRGKGPEGLWEEA